MAKHYDTLKYIEEDEEEPIVFFQHPKKTRKRTLQVPSIPFVGINLVVMSSQEEILLVEEEHVHKQTYLLIETM